MRIKYCLLLLFSIIVNAQTQSPQCQPINLGTEYQLIEGLTGDSSQGCYVLNIAPFSVKPGCSDESKYVNLYQGKIIFSFSSISSGTGFSSLSVTNTCSGQILFSIIAQNLGYQVNAANGSCLAQV